MRFAWLVARRYLRSPYKPAVLRLVTLFSVIGIAIFALLSRLLASMAYGVRAADPVTLFAVAGFMWVVGVCASWLPARAASRADPVDALGAE